MFVVLLFLVVPFVCLQFVIVAFPDQTHLLYQMCVVCVLFLMLLSNMFSFTSLPYAVFDFFFFTLTQVFFYDNLSTVITVWFFVGVFAFNRL